MASANSEPWTFIGQGDAIPIYTEEGGEYKLHKQNLKDILLQDGVRELPIMVLSIAGGMREGKSFMLNFFIKYLESGMADNWLEDQTSELRGFSWRGGCERDTLGILMWSKPYYVNTRTGKVAVLLLDTQGAFDTVQEMRQSTKIFTMSLLLSSYQVYNVMGNLRVDKLDYFRIFMEHAKAVKREAGQKLFQSLLFLVRDWSDEESHDYGLVEGTKYIHQQIAECSRTDTSRSSGESLKDVFKDINGFLMPHPGPKVAQRKKNQEPFKGALKDIDHEFVELLPDLTRAFFNERSIVPKKFGGKIIHGRELVKYAKVFSNILQRDDLPGANDILQAVMLVHSNAMSEEACDSFRQKLEEVVRGKPFLNDEDLVEKGRELMNDVITQFTNRPTFGNEEKKRFMSNMRSKLEFVLERCNDKNKLKRGSLRDRYSDYVSLHVEDVTKELQKLFSDRSVEETLIMKTCEEYKEKEIQALKSENLGSQEFDEEFENRIKAEFESLCRTLLTENKSKENHIRKICSERVSVSMERARKQMEQELKHQFHASEGEVDVLLEGVKKEILSDWNNGLEMTEEIREEYCTKISEKLHELRPTFLSWWREYEEKCNTKSILEKENALRWYEDEMVKLLNDHPWTESEIHDFHLKMSQHAKEMFEASDLPATIRTRGLAELVASLAKNFEKFKNSNQNKTEDFARRYKLLISQCMIDARIRLKQKCGTQCKTEEDVMKVFEECRRGLLDQFEKGCLQGPDVVVETFRKELEKEAENILHEANEINDRNRELMEKKSWENIMQVKSLYKEQMQTALSREEAFDDDDLLQIHKASRQKAVATILGDCVSKTETDHIISKLDAALTSAWSKFQKQNSKKRIQNQQRIKEVVRECIAIYDTQMDEACENLLPDAEELEQCHSKSSNNTMERFDKFRELVPDAMYASCMELLHTQMIEKYERFKQVAVQKRKWAENKSLNTVKKMISFYKSQVEIKTRRLACSDYELQQFCIEAAEATMSNLLITTSGMAESLRETCEKEVTLAMEGERMNFVIANNDKNDAMEGECKNAADRSLEIFKDIIEKGSKDYLEDEALHRLHERAAKKARAWFQSHSPKGNQENIQKYQQQVEEDIEDEEEQTRLTNTENLKKKEQDAYKNCREVVDKYKAEMNLEIGTGIRQDGDLQSFHDMRMHQAELSVRDLRLPKLVEESALLKVKAEITKELQVMRKENERRKVKEENEISEHIDACFEKYEKIMKQSLTEYVSEEELMAKHQEALEKAESKFKKKLWSTEVKEKFKRKLKKRIGSKLTVYRRTNEANKEKANQSRASLLRKAKEDYETLMNEKLNGAWAEENELYNHHVRCKEELKSKLQDQKLSDYILRGLLDEFEDKMKLAYADVQSKNSRLKDNIVVRLSSDRAESLKDYKRRMDEAFEDISTKEELRSAHDSCRKEACKIQCSTEKIPRGSHILVEFEKGRDQDIDEAYKDYVRKIKKKSERLDERFDGIINSCLSEYKSSAFKKIQKLKSWWVTNKGEKLESEHGRMKDDCVERAKKEMRKLGNDEQRDEYLRKLEKGIGEFNQKQVEDIQDAGLISSIAESIGGFFSGVASRFVQKSSP